MAILTTTNVQTTGNDVMIAHEDIAFSIKKCICFLTKADWVIGVIVVGLTLEDVAFSLK